MTKHSSNPGLVGPGMLIQRSDTSQQDDSCCTHLRRSEGRPAFNCRLVYWIVLLGFMIQVYHPVGQAQTLKGIVRDAQSGEPLPAVYISNTTQKQVTLSDPDGIFNIPARKGNSIDFSYVGHTATHLIVGEEDSVTIVLQRKPYTLDDVEIRPDWTPYQLDSLKRRGIYGLDLDRKKVSGSVWGSVMSPASALAEQFNKKSKQRFRFQKNFVKWENQHFVDTRYTPEEVTSLTGLTGDTLFLFMNSHPMPYDFARAATDLEIKMWIRYNYREWLSRQPVLAPKDSTVFRSGVADTVRQ